ncbi:hypothetical protein PsorP6_007040 [Peronosclerospora sorghi]|uniref:Uncharacterized protein n=1 Tax=Peronosclerospora sorghi TaxID=230839 RepID=A0ACC0W9Y3_9STRA|nr:hypothetical protein PsorP6_007040 [Peronosclerospora sorghi]
MDLKLAMQLEKQELKKIGTENEDNHANTSSSSPCWHYPQQRRAASFSTGHYHGCSPPLPIPDVKHCYNAKTYQESREGRHCDKTWNSKLSFESLETSIGHLKRHNQLQDRAGDELIDRMNRMTLFKLTSVASTAETVDEDDEDLNDSIKKNEDMYYYGDVFTMDDV